jgi:predicted RecB family endonuclease
MSSLFCSSSDKITSTVKVAANVAGILIGANNPQLVTLLPAVQVVLAKVTGGGDNVAMNALINQGITELISQYSNNPAVKVEALIVTEALGLNVAGAVPTLSNTEITELLNSFIAGL